MIERGGYLLKEELKNILSYKRSERMKKYMNSLSKARRAEKFGSQKEKHPLYGIGHSEKTKMLISKNHRDFSGKNNPMYGKKHSEEVCEAQAIRASKQFKGIPFDEEHKRKIQDAHRNIKDVECPYCDKKGHPSPMKRWHFNNCKLKGNK